MEDVAVDVDVMSPSIRASVAAIERGLAERPIGATISDSVPDIEPADESDEDDDPQPFRKALPHAGPWKCRSGCGATLAAPGICEACGSASVRAEAEEVFRAALDSIPPAFRWAHVGSPALDRVGGVVLNKHGAPLSMARQVVPRIVDGIVSGKVRVFLLRGLRNGGKTAICCAAIRLLVDRAVDALIAFERIRPADRRAPAPPEPPIVTLARGARIIAARNLAPERLGGTSQFAAAIKATVLGLDDIGEEAVKADGSKVDGFDATDKLQLTGHVVTERWDARAAIIGTSTLDDRAILRKYKGAVERRLIRSKQAKRIEFVQREDHEEESEREAR